MSDSLVASAGQVISSAQEVALTSHIRPDGDAVGSVLGLGLALEEAGKKVQMALVDGVPENLRHLPGADRVQKRLEEIPDLVIFLDCADRERVGDLLPDGLVPDINIDHHITNLNFAKLNLVDAEAVSTSAMLADFIPAWGLPMNAEIAAALLNGLITDSLGFRTSNMSSHALRVAADLMDHGANLPDLYTKALLVRKFEAMRFWGVGLGSLQRQGRLIWTAITQAERNAVGYPGRDDADLVNLLATIRDQKITVIFVEQPSGDVKVSWRAAPGYDVSKIALRFGGGGHPAAAGATIPGELETVQQAVLEATQRMFSRDGSKKFEEIEVSI
jgi:phosphoesterase RecJ-like protein